MPSGWLVLQDQRLTWDSNRRWCLSETCRGKFYNWILAFRHWQRREMFIYGVNEGSRCWSGSSFLNYREWNGMHDALHSPWPSGSEDIEFISYGGHIVVTCRHPWGYLLWMDPPAWPTAWHNRCIRRRLTVINSELGAKEIWPDLIFFRKKN